MKIVSWNVNGIRALVKKDLFKAIEILSPDILCLQETRAQNQEIEEALLPLKNYRKYFNSAEKKGYSGTAILSKSKSILSDNFVNISAKKQEGRIQCVAFENFYLVNVYVPNSGQKLERLNFRKQWDIDFLNYIKDLEKTKPVIICGDFNVAHKAIDLKNDKSNYNKTAGYTQIEIDGIDHLIKAGFIDSFRYFYPDKIAYTFWSYRFKSRERNTGWRIDYFLISKSLIKKVKGVAIYSDIFGSDHCPISLEIDV
ncbi:exodeoxyribonuclease-3 [Polaribacter sp. KT25b]|nr:exodeoxyribonuclease III [Polaribacter sp. KT25b]SDS24274.1 exodeoxyribonuclease-3 [Polaribacter sp. KT25b]